MNALLQLIHHIQPFYLAAGDYVLPVGKGGFKNLGVYIDMCSNFIWVTKVKAAGTVKTTLASLQIICLGYATPQPIMMDGGSHFKNAEVNTFCDNNGIKHITTPTLRVSTSALVGDPDPYPQVYSLSKLKLRSM
jgi:hypothetical protein